MGRAPSGCVAVTLRCDHRNMCSTCDSFEERIAAGSLSRQVRGRSSVGRAPAWHAGGPWVRVPSPPPVEVSNSYALAGLVAAEGSFWSTADDPPTRVDGSPRRRFAFSITMADRDRPLLAALQELFGVGSLQERPSTNPRWLPTTTFSVSSRLAHRTVTIPFFDAHLLPCAKRRQFETWRTEFEDYERRYPTRIGLGPSTCSEPGCEGA